MIDNWDSNNELKIRYKRFKSHLSILIFKIQEFKLLKYAINRTKHVRLNKQF